RIARAAGRRHRQRQAPELSRVADFLQALAGKQAIAERLQGNGLARVFAPAAAAVEDAVERIIEVDRRQRFDDVQAVIRGKQRRRVSLGLVLAQLLQLALGIDEFEVAQREVIEARDRTPAPVIAVALVAHDGWRTFQQNDLVAYM